MVLCIHVSLGSPPFSSCQWQVFCFMQGCEANSNSLFPHLCSFALILKDFPPTLGHLWTCNNPLGQLRTFYHLLGQLVACWASKLVKTLQPVQLVVIKLCWEFELRVPCACVALWLVGFASVFKISPALSLHMNNWRNMRSHPSPPHPHPCPPSPPTFLKFSMCSPGFYLWDPFHF